MFYFIVKMISIVGVLFCFASATTLSICYPSRTDIFGMYMMAGFLFSFMLAAFNEVTTMISPQRKKVMRTMRFQPRHFFFTILAGLFFSTHIFILGSWQPYTSLENGVIIYQTKNLGSISYVMYVVLKFYSLLAWAGLFSMIFVEDYYYHKLLKQEKSLEPLRIF